MAIRDRIRRWLFSDSLSAGDHERWWWPFGGGAATSAGITVSAESAIRVSAVYACVRVLSETMAQLPVHVYERQTGGRKRFAEEHKLNQLFLSPNGWQTWFEFVEFQMGALGLRGNAYAERLGGPLGTASALRPLRADRMKVERLTNDKLRYTFSNPDTHRDETFSQEEIFHIRGPHMSGDGLIGMSPVSAAKEAIGLSVATEAHGATFFGNGARPGFAFISDQPIKREAAEQVLQGWTAVHGGAFNHNKPAILPYGLKPAMIGMSNEDSQFLDTRRFQVEEIARIYRVPLHLIGDLTRSTNNNIEHQSLEFVMYTMLPWIRRWEQAISRDLLAEPERYYVKFNVNGLLRGDSAARSAFYREMVNAGIFDIDTCLELEDMNPIKNGDVHLVQGAMTTLDRIVNPPEPMAPMAPMPPDETKPDAEDELRMERAKRVELEIAVAKLEAQYECSRIKYGEECAATKRVLGELTTAMQVQAEAERERLQAKLEAEQSKEEAGKLAGRIAALEQQEMALREQHNSLAKQLDESLAVNKAAVSLAGGMVLDAMTRMLSMETDGVKRAMSKANFLAALDDFYEGHEERLSVVLEGPLRLHSELTGADVGHDRIAREHVEESKQQLLAAAEVSADELAESVLTCLDGWSERAEQLAEQIKACYQETKNDNDPQA